MKYCFQITSQQPNKTISNIDITNASDAGNFQPHVIIQPKVVIQGTTVNEQIILLLEQELLSKQFESDK